MPSLSRFLSFFFDFFSFFLRRLRSSSESEAEESLSLTDERRLRRGEREAVDEGETERRAGAGIQLDAYRDCNKLIRTFLGFWRCIRFLGEYQFSAVDNRDRRQRAISIIYLHFFDGLYVLESCISSVADSASSSPGRSGLCVAYLERLFQTHYADQ